MTKQEQMYRLIEEQQSGSQTAIAFCEHHQINLGTFNYWLRKKRQEGRTSFIPVDIKPGVEGKAELIYPNGVRIRLESFDPDKIRQLINLV